MVDRAWGVCFVVCVVIWMMCAPIPSASARPSKVGLADIRLLKQLGYTDTQLIKWLGKHRLKGTFRLHPTHILRLHKQGFSIALLRYMGIATDAHKGPAGLSPQPLLLPKTNVPKRPALGMMPQMKPLSIGQGRAPIHAKDLPFSTRVLRHFALTLPIPSQWKKVYFRLPHVLHYQIPLKAPRRAALRYKAMIEVMLGVSRPPRQQQVVLRQWLIKRLYPDAVVTHIGSLFRRRRREKRYSFRVHSQRSWKSANAHGSSILVHVFNRRGRFHGRLGAHLANIKGVTIFVGAELSLQTRYLSSARYRQIKVGFVALVTRHLPWLLRQAHVGAYQVQQKPHKRLIRKGRYRYVFQRNLSLRGGYGATSFSSQRSITWRFARDGSCQVKRKGFAGVFSSFHDGAGRSTGTGGFSRKRRHLPGVGVCQTLALPGGGMWLAFRLPDGFSQLHRLEFAKRGKYGPFAYHGLAIDGIVEGRYSSGNNYKVYKPW